MRRRVGWLLFPFCWALACGGRFEKVTADGDDDVGGTSTGQGGSVQSKAGSVSQGGSAGRGGTVGRAGSKSTGGGGKGGASSKGGAGGKATGGGVAVGGTFSQGGACACDAIACAPGYIEVPNPNGCCFHCELDPTCDQQRKDYQAYRQQLLDKYSTYPCMVDSDCSIYYEKNNCGYSCGISIATATIQNLDSNLNSYAAMACNPGCIVPVPPCEPTPPPACFKGYCE
jgi:hypothetical protein